MNEEAQDPAAIPQYSAGDSPPPYSESEAYPLVQPYPVPQQHPTQAQEFQPTITQPLHTPAVVRQ